MSIQRRLALSTTLVLLFSLLVASGLTYGHAVSKVRTEVEAALAVAASSALSSLDDGDDRADPDRKLRAVVRDFDGDRHVRAALVAPDGRVLAQSRPLAPDEATPGWFYRLLRPRLPSREPMLPASFRLAGRLVLDADPHNEVAEAWSDTILMLEVMAVFFAAVLALAFLTIRGALAPLRDVCDALGRVGQGNAGAASAGPGEARGRAVHLGRHLARELMPLRDGFNAMAGRLAAADEQNRLLNEQIITIQEEERAELARDLHDDVAPFVFAVGADAAMIRQYLAKGSTAEIGPRAESIADAVRHMQRHLKDVLARLAPGALLDLGLSGAVDNLVAFWASRRPAVRISSAIDGEPLDPPLDAVAFRVVQESVSNALRHGDPSRIAITVLVDEARAAVTVADDGGGFADGEARFGFGLTGMKERLRSVGGTLSLQGGGPGSERGGVTVRAVLPLRQADQADGAGLSGEAPGIMRMDADA